MMIVGINTEAKGDFNMFNSITIIEVQKRTSAGNNQVWVVTRCDNDPDVVGTVTGCGLPCRANDVPLGTTFQTILTIPESKEKEC